MPTRRAGRRRRSPCPRRSPPRSAPADRSGPAGGSAPSGRAWPGSATTTVRSPMASRASASASPTVWPDTGGARRGRDGRQQRVHLAGGAGVDRQAGAGLGAPPSAPPAAPRPAAPPPGPRPARAAPPTAPAATASRSDRPAAACPPPACTTASRSGSGASPRRPALRSRGESNTRVNTLTCDRTAGPAPARRPVAGAAPAPPPAAGPARAADGRYRISAVAPMVMVSPANSGRSPVSRSPLTPVPFMLPRSRTRTSPPSIRISAWRREAAGSDSFRSASVSRPISSTPLAGSARG